MELLITDKGGNSGESITGKSSVPDDWIRHSEAITFPNPVLGMPSKTTPSFIFNLLASLRFLISIDKYYFDLNVRSSNKEIKR
jgi:hypothetical protein